MQRRFRPLGLSLAILAPFFADGFFSLIPTLFVILLSLEGHPLIPTEGAFWLPPLFGVILIVLSIFAWFGRPTWIRGIFLLIVTLATFSNVYEAIRPSQLTFTQTQGISGGTLGNAFQQALLCLAPLRLFILAYTLWYVNRAPARAFFAPDKPA